MKSQVCMVLCTVPHMKNGRELSRTLVREKLAACVSIIPGLCSIYEWEGKLHEEEECQLLIKTTHDRLTILQDRLLELHTYDLPEFIVLSPESCSQAYGEWVVEQTESQP